MHPFPLRESVRPSVRGGGCTGAVQQTRSASQGAQGRQGHPCSGGGGPRTRKQGRKGIWGPGAGENPVCVPRGKRQAGLKTQAPPDFKNFSGERLPSAGVFGNEQAATLNRRRKERDRQRARAVRKDRDRQREGGRKVTLGGRHSSARRCRRPGHGPSRRDPVRPFPSSVCNPRPGGSRQPAAARGATGRRAAGTATA